ncbi:MAG: DMT family transporter [Pseudomonadota bacterium]
MSNPTVCISILLLMNVFWSGANAVVKYGLGSMDPLVLVFWRVLLGLIILLSWIIIRRYPLNLDLRDGLRIVFAGLCLAASNILIVTGIELSHATDASLLFVFEPVWGIVLATIILKERLLPTTVIALMLVLGGLLGLSGFDLHKFLDIVGNNGVGLGNVLIVTGIMSEGLFTIIINPVATKRPAPVIISGVLLTALLVLSLPIYFRGGISIEIAPASLFAIIYLGLICTACGYTLWIAIMKSVPVNVMLFTIFLQPIAGTLIAATTLGEPIDKRLLTGGTLLIAGMAFAVIGHVRASRKDKRISLDPAFANAPGI